MAKTDRRAQRTRELLQNALIDLIRERGYDVITIQDIVDRANVGRTTFFQGRDSLLILRRIRDRNAQEIEGNLHAAFDENQSVIPFDLLATYLARAEIALVQWWLEKRQARTVENLAQVFHQLQRAVIREAFERMEDEEGPYIYRLVDRGPSWRYRA